ncbi:hypothetical protein SSP531S_24620 [Streptomyces spongiicola]|uniref:Uncharacterized protein n=1 Tax=Streptomyces spongiicola TaxID=1690221 RepID=A0A388SYT8_9ACTN|nr:hypothetical protein [Streptomyces spongiicola]GBQ01032.1 hypothetical protein SSP531S_24620 [Streptomyces spongiicola]
MAAPLTPEQRETVLAAAREPGATRNGVARTTGVSRASVTRICQSAGLTFDRTTTEAAVEARTTDLRAARTTEAQHAITAAGEMLQGARQAYMDGEARDARDYATAYGKFIAAHIALQRHDAGDSGGLADVDRWLLLMTGGSQP